MRIIVEAFKDSLELGLEKPSQIVVSIKLCTTSWSVKVEVRLHSLMLMFIVFFFTPISMVTTVRINN